MRKGRSERHVDGEHNAVRNGDAVGSRRKRARETECGGEGDGGEQGGAGGRAMNISPPHLFMQYFALAGLRLLAPSRPPAPLHPSPTKNYPAASSAAASPRESSNKYAFSVLAVFANHREQKLQKFIRTREKFFLRAIDTCDLTRVITYSEIFERKRRIKKKQSK